MAQVRQSFIAAPLGQTERGEKIELFALLGGKNIVHVGLAPKAGRRTRAWAWGAPLGTFALLQALYGTPQHGITDVTEAIHGQIVHAEATVTLTLSPRGDRATIPLATFAAALNQLQSAATAAA